MGRQMAHRIAFKRSECVKVVVSDYRGGGGGERTQRGRALQLRLGLRKVLCEVSFDRVHPRLALGSARGGHEVVAFGRLHHKTVWHLTLRDTAMLREGEQGGEEKEGEPWDPQRGAHRSQCSGRSRPSCPSPSSTSTHFIRGEQGAEERSGEPQRATATLCFASGVGLRVGMEMEI